MTTDTANAGPRGAWGWALAGILILGAVLRFVHLDAGLWYDEISTQVQYVERPLATILTTYDSQNQHLLYSILARLAWVTVGPGDVALRLPAVLAGILSLGLVAWFGARLIPRREALLAALLLAVSYHHVWFSQNARGYTILLCVALASTASILELLQRAGARRAVAAYAVVMALGLYTNVTAGFVAAAHGLVWLALLVRGRLAAGVRWQAGMAFAATLALTTLLYLPVLKPMLATVLAPTMATASAGVEWKNPLWFLAETARGLAAGVPGGWAGLVAGLIVVGAGLASLGARQPLALVLMLLPGIVTAVAMLATAHNLWPRLFFFAAGFGALIAVRGGCALLERLWPARAAAVGTAAVLLVCAGSLTTVPGAWRPKQDYAGARDWLQEHAGGGALIATVDMARFPYERWLRTGWRHAATEAELAALEADGATLYVVTTFPVRLEAMQPGMARRLERDYREVWRGRGTVGGGDVIVMRYGT